MQPTGAGVNVRPENADRRYRPMVATCPYCGHEIDKPVLFSRTRQRIFAYIWDNPNTTAEEIHEAIYGNKPRHRYTVTVHVNRIAIRLRDHGYRIVRTGDHRYKIIKPQVVRIIDNESQPTEGKQDGTV